MRKKVLAEESIKQGLNKSQFAEQTKLLFPIVSGERNDTHLSGALRLLNRISKPASDMLPDAGSFDIEKTVPQESSPPTTCSFASGSISPSPFIHHPRIFPLTASAFSCTIAQNPERSYGNDVQHAPHDHHPAARGTVSAGLHCRTRFPDPPWVNGAFYGSRRCRSKQASICTVFSLSKGGRPHAGTVRAPPGE